VIALETLKQLRRGRTLLSLAMLGVVPVLMGAALALGGGPDAGEGPPFIARATTNGLWLPIAAVGATSQFFLLVVAALFMGEGISSETGWGTERYLLVRPVARTHYLVTKIAVGLILTALSVAIVALVALAVGAALFGIHAIAFFGVQLTVPQTLARLAAMVALVTFNLGAIGAVGVLVAVTMESSAGAVVTAVGFGITSQILDAISAVGGLRRFLPTHYWDSWLYFFGAGASAADVRSDILIVAGYAVAILMVASWLYDNKDVTA
jgi:ABC-2 type transport system permease protein